MSGDCKNDVSSFLYSDGRKVYGNFANGIIEGVVVCYYPDGQKYIGAWACDEKHGAGFSGAAYLGMVVRLGSPFKTTKN